MRITYQGPFRDGVIISVPGHPQVHARPGEAVEVAEDLGASLLEQDIWTAASPAKPGRAAASSAAAAAADTKED